MNGDDKHKPRPKSKPGSSFSFKPRTNIASAQEPTFANPRRLHTNTNSTNKTSEAIMVKERAPPKAPLQSTHPNTGPGAAREMSPEDDITALIGGFASLKGNVRQAYGDPSQFASASTSRPTFGHPTKMMSSRKQKADPFIRQRTRPEHHLDGNRVTGPQAPTYQDKRPPPMEMFSSNAPHVPIRAPPSRAYGEEVFFTDPAKASADLKALLEGGMDDEDDEEEEETPQSQDSQQSQQSQETATGVEATTETKTKAIAKNGAKDGTIKGLKVKLLPHQVEGVQWMRGRELGPVKRGRVPKGGILADDMGLGKTLQTISLILMNQKPKEGAPGWKKQFDKVQKTTLVVAPLALIRQWEHEIKDKVEKSHGLKVCVHHGPQRSKRYEDLVLYDVVITTYQILVSEHGNSSEAENGPKVGCFGAHWWRVVLDEAHTIKNRNAKATKACYALRAEYRWCLSGTPMQNNLDELQSLVKFLRIRPYDDLKEWKAHIDQPMKNGKGHIAIKRLHSLLRCFMKRRTKEVLKEDGALNPGGKPTAEGERSSTGFKVTERKVVTVKTALSPAERKFYARLEARTDRSIQNMLRGRVNYANALTLLLRLRQACNHPKLVEGKLEKDKDAMSTDSSQKSQAVDVDSMADMFAGMGIESKNCNICGRGLTSVDSEMSREICSECHDDLEYFNNHEKPAKQEKTPKDKIKKRVKKSKLKVKEKVVERKIVEVAVPAKAARRPRNRNAIIDSDDEEEAEGSWLVPEDQRGSFNLGKAGGQEDEDAEGGGEDLGSEDSSDEEDSRAQDQSNLSSFVVDDEAARNEKGYRSAHEASDTEEDSLMSLTALTKKMAAQTLDDGPDSSAVDTSLAASSVADTSTAVDSSAVDTTTAADSEASSDSSDDSEDHSEDDPSVLVSDDDDDVHHPGYNPQASHVLASAKIRELIKILQGEVREHKFIVFSQFTSMLNLVEPFIRKEGFSFVRYDGSMKNDEREASLRSLRTDDDTRILLCSLKCGSLGLNLTAATRVVILEPFWNPVRSLSLLLSPLYTMQC